LKFLYVPDNGISMAMSAITKIEEFTLVEEAVR